MSQSQKPTRQGYAETAKLVAGEAATKCAKIVAYEGDCAAASEASTYATPAATKSTKSGFAVGAANTVITVTTSFSNDTVQVDHVFTAGEAATITGFGVCNNEATPDVLFAECCFAAGIPLETAETLAVQMKMMQKLGS
ncbi:MAG: hypothetical protein WC455_16290 [Dehalococcoidia bacterium]